MLIVVRKTCDFLDSQSVSPRLIFVRLVLCTFGRRIVVFNPLNLFIGWILKIGIWNYSRFHDLLCKSVVCTEYMIHLLFVRKVRLKYGYYCAVPYRAYVSAADPHCLTPDFFHHT